MKKIYIVRACDEAHKYGMDYNGHLMTTMHLRDATHYPTHEEANLLRRKMNLARPQYQWQIWVDSSDYWYDPGCAGLNGQYRPPEDCDDEKTDYAPF